MIKNLINKLDYAGLNALLEKMPRLANEGIGLDDGNPALAHPLHRICDGVFNGVYSDDDAVKLATIFLNHGANVNGIDVKENKDTPLIAAASLNAEKVGMLYIEKGADIHHPGCHGGTALHWAAWCGKDKLVRKLIEANAQINKLCVDFKSTPLFWAIHGLKYGGAGNVHHQAECARVLIEAGADKSIPNFEGYKPIQLLNVEDSELIKILS